MAVGGRYLDDTYADGEIRSIWIQREGSDRNRPEDIESLMLRNRDGELVSAESVARL
jgi:multidrug efflux pump subunit AcrB